MGRDATAKGAGPAGRTLAASWAAAVVFVLLLPSLSFFFCYTATAHEKVFILFLLLLCVENGSTTRKPFGSVAVAVAKENCTNYYLRGRTQNGMEQSQSQRVSTGTADRVYSLSGYIIHCVMTLDDGSLVSYWFGAPNFSFSMTTN